MLTREMATERARLGAAFLDARVPGWAEKIDVAALDLWSCTECVLGQLFGDFSGGVDAIRLDHGGVIICAYGFDLMANDANRGSYNHLNAAWRAEILARVGHPAETEAEAREAQDRAVLEQAGYVACLRPEAIGPERRARVIGSNMAMAKGGAE